ncbi:MAG: hypothetical protein QNJ46_34330 [Leptolyngbyaceae cyanobacterium MO_188.B28]|nr:hypothetical protein [Leptolyngbyaceae cyanobacterium MO_188.B28]
MPKIIQFASEFERYIRLHVYPLHFFVKQFFQKPSSESPSPVVVSLTTIPDRIHRLLPTLNSILSQTIRPNAIYLNIPHHSQRQEQDYEIPKQIQACSPIQILRTDQDWGPATKLLPLLQQTLSPETQIIVLDDDQIYPQRLIENYLRYSRQYPDAALCLAGWQIPKGLIHKLRTPLEGARTRLLDRPPNVFDTPQPVEIIQGSTSYLVRPKFFDPTILNYEKAPSAAFFADDIWISGHLARNQIPRLVIPGNFHYARIQALTALKTLSLCQAENKDGKNNQLLYEFFQQDWQRFA